MERFGKDQHELLIRQLFHIRQTGSVQEYADKFTSIVDGLIAYGKNIDPIYYAMKFVDGLRDEIRTVVHMQRPGTLDTIVVLALLQEEMLDSSRKKELRRYSSWVKFRAGRSVYCWILAAPIHLSVLHLQLIFKAVPIVFAPPE